MDASFEIEVLRARNEQLERECRSLRARNRVLAEQVRRLREDARELTVGDEPPLNQGGR